METSNNGGLNGEFGKAEQGFGRIGMGEFLIRKPNLLLFGIWTLYLVIDLSATLILYHGISDWMIPFYNFVAGFSVILIFFNLFMPFIYLRRKYALAILILIFSLVIFSGIKFEILRIFFVVPEDLKGFLVFEFLRLFQFLVFAWIIWMLRQHFLLWKKKFEMEVEFEKLQMEHRSLQLSPHFVLNTLSYTLSKIADLSPNLLQDFLSLTSLLRYSFKEYNKPNSIHQELDAVKYYLNWQELRFEKLHLAVKMKIVESESYYSMPKLCLLTLIENVFFHGNYQDSSDPCKLSFLLLEVKDGYRFTMSISNLKRKEGVGRHSGFGSKTVFKVLSHHFGSRFNHFISEEEEEFSLLMIIEYER